MYIINKARTSEKKRIKSGILVIIKYNEPMIKIGMFK